MTTKGVKAGMNKRIMTMISLKKTIGNASGWGCEEKLYSDIFRPLGHDVGLSRTSQVSRPRHGPHEASMKEHSWSGSIR